jgi:RNA polymerase sigma-70 factor (ECF subfamily)
MRFLWKVAAPRAGGEASDGELLERFADTRDESAFTALVQRHGPMVFGVCRSILNDPNDADDAFQATFLVLVRKARSIGKPDSVASWLHGVAYRIASKARGAAARRRHQERQAPTMSGSQPDDEAVWRDIRPLLHMEVERLPERYRKPFVLCYLEGKTNDEAAQILGWPKGTVLSSLSRAREKLRERLTRQGVALPAAVLTAMLARSEAPAAVPAVLAEATVRSALLYAATPVAAGISAGALAHTQSMLQSMFLARVKMIAAFALLAAAIGTGGGLIVYHARSPEAPAAAAKTDAPPPPQPPPAAEGPEVIVPPAKVPSKPDRELLRGTWLVVSGEQNGRAIDEMVKDDRLIFTADDFSMNAQKGEPVRLFRRGLTVGRYKLDPESRPRRIELTIEKTRTLQGIYLLDGDTLKICLGHPEAEKVVPTEFATKPDDRQLLLLLRRQ